MTVQLLNLILNQLQTQCQQSSVAQIRLRAQFPQFLPEFIRLSQQITMGQCIQVTVNNTRCHPFLGQLLEVEIKSKPFLLLSQPVFSQEDYIDWSKVINRLKLSNQIKDYLYLPLTQDFKKSQGMCNAFNKLQLTFIPYKQTLAELISEYSQNRQYCKELQLWYLLYILVKYVKHLQKAKEQLKEFNFDNVLLCSDDSLKIIPSNMMLNTAINLKQLSQDDSQLKLSTKKTKAQEQPHSNIYLVGLMVLGVADTVQPQQFYNTTEHHWKSVSAAKITKHLSHLDQRYSKILIQTLSQMMEPSLRKRISTDNLMIRLENYENQILGNKRFGIHQNCHSNESFHDFFDIKSTTIQNSRINLNFQDQLPEQSIRETTPNKLAAYTPSYSISEDYLNIL